MRVTGPEGEVLENRERGRRPGEQGMCRGRRICTFSNMILWRPIDAHILGEETVYDFKPPPCVFLLFFVMGSRVTVTDPCEGEEGQGETLMVGCPLRYAPLRNGLYLSQGQRSLPTHLLVREGLRLCSRKSFPGNTDNFQGPQDMLGSEWAVRTQGTGQVLPNQGALMRATPLRSECPRKGGSGGVSGGPCSLSPWKGWVQVPGN